MICSKDSTLIFSGKKSCAIMNRRYVFVDYLYSLFNLYNGVGKKFQCIFYSFYVLILINFSGEVEELDDDGDQSWYDLC